MANRLKPILLLLGLTVLFFLVAPYLLQAVFSIIKKPYTAIRYAEAVQGRITSVEIERQFHMYYLDNNTKRWYSFNAFLPPLSPAQRQHLSQEDGFNLTLGRNLEVGDYVSKQANSTVITVQRGDSISRYFCATPEEIEQSRK
jgi:hypothetical protein